MIERVRMSSEGHLDVAFMVGGYQTKVLLSVALARYLRTAVEEALSLNIPAREERTRLEGMGGIPSSASVRRRTMMECRRGSVRELCVYTYKGLVAAWGGGSVAVSRADYKTRSFGRPWLRWALPVPSLSLGVRDGK